VIIVFLTIIEPNYLTLNVMDNFIKRPNLQKLKNKPPICSPYNRYEQITDTKARSTTSDHSER